MKPGYCATLAITAAITLCGSGSWAVASPAPDRPEPESTVSPRAVTSSVWDLIAKCESSGDWQANTGNGYYGGLQFTRKTWLAHGGSLYAAYPHQAAREEQIAVADRLFEKRGGYGDWPACAKKLSLPH